MKIDIWPISRPQPYPRNARKIGDLAIDKVARSITEFGWRQPIVVDTENVVIVGHVRLMAAKKLGLKEVPVHVAENLSPEQVKAYRLMDNRSQDETQWDYELLGQELLHLKELEIDLGLTGFDPFEIDPILAAEWAPANKEGDLGADHTSTHRGPVIPVTEDELAVIEAAIAAMRIRQSNATLTPGAVVALLATEFLAGVTQETAA
jgi:hypothetical protein